MDDETKLKEHAKTSMLIHVLIMIVLFVIEAYVFPDIFKITRDGFNLWSSRIIEPLLAIYIIDGIIRWHKESVQGDLEAIDKTKESYLELLPGNFAYAILISLCIQKNSDRINFNSNINYRGSVNRNIPY